MECFALGGILVKEVDIPTILDAHKNFCDKWTIDYPLHSQEIRGARGQFGWLGKPENALEFLSDLNDYLVSLPMVCIASVIHRPGYLQRYKDEYQERLWLMCKTNYSILLERAAKYADERGCKLEVHFEECGRKEDRDITAYTKELKTTGSPFAETNSDQYSPLSADDYRRIVLGEPQRKTKKVPLIQIADLVLYPMAKAGYDPNYRPYKALVTAGKLIDSEFEQSEIPVRGIKYSCFDG